MGKKTNSSVVDSHVPWAPIYKVTQGSAQGGGPFGSPPIRGLLPPCLSSLAQGTPIGMNTNIVAPTYSSIYTIDAAVGVLSP